MSVLASASLIPELENVIQHGTAQRRTDAVRRIANLFVDSARNFNEDHVGLFDDVLCRLMVKIENKVRAEISTRLSIVDNAPAELMRKFARDDDIEVAGPVIAQSVRLDDIDLVDIAKTKGQAHLAALSERSGIGEGVTDVLVKRGDPEVVRKVADNRTARLSETGFSTLVQHADHDGVLAEKVGARPDIPSHLFRDLLVRATAVVQKRLLSAAKPETKAEIQRVLDKVAEEFGRISTSRDYVEAMRTALEMKQAGRLNQAALAEFATAKKYEETVASLAVLSGVPIETADRLMTGDRPDPILILCKAAGFSWTTARAIMLTRAMPKEKQAHAIDAAFANCEKLSPSTAQRVVRFWQVSDPEEAV